MAANVSTNLASWSTTESSNSPAGTDTSDIDAELRMIQTVVRKYLATKGADIASAATVDLSAATGNYVHITGTTTVTALGTVSAGMRFMLVFDGALTFTHNATSLILPGAANITTAAGDRCEVVSLGSGNWRCLWYTKASGAPVGSYQPLDADLTALAGLTSAANKIPMFSGSGTATVIDFLDEDAMTSNSATAVPSQQSVKAYVDAEVAGVTVTNITLGTPQASTSGTAMTFTGIPAGTKRITMSLVGVSLSGTASVMVQIGDVDGFEATGYVGAGHNGAGTNNTNSTGFYIQGGVGVASAVYNGKIVLELENASAFTWVETGLVNRSDGPFVNTSAGSKSLSAELTQVRLTTDGADTFDLGEVNIAYE